jgi:hypothetical protein
MEEDGASEVAGHDEVINIDVNDEGQKMIVKTTPAMNFAPVSNESSLIRDINEYRKLPIMPINLDILTY